MDGVGDGSEGESVVDEVVGVLLLVADSLCPVDACVDLVGGELEGLALPFSSEVGWEREGDGDCRHRYLLFLFRVVLKCRSIVYCTERWLRLLLVRVVWFCEKST